MKKQALGVILLSVFVFMFILGHNLSAQDQEGWGGSTETPTSSTPEGTEGFGVSLKKSSKGVVTETNITEISKDGVGSETASVDGTASEADTLEGTIDVDTYLNIRTGPWGKIIGGLNNREKVTILSKEGDWFKILKDGKEGFIHAYYVDAPGFPSHQGVEPPILGSDQAPFTGVPGSSATVDNGTFGAEPCEPMPDSVSSDFGPRDIGIGSTFHEGIDLPVPNGTRLNALGNGTVTEVGWSDGGGKFVRVRYDNGYSSFYCHLESVSVSEGQSVAIGQDIARSDNTGEWTTGAHLHMGITDSSGNSVNPRDVPGLEFPPLVE